MSERDTALTPAAEEDRGEPDDSWKEALEGDLFGLVGSAALAAGVTVTVEQSLAIAHAVMRYMLADESLPLLSSPRVEGETWMPIETAPKNHLPVLVWSLEEGRTVAFQDVTWAWWPCPASYPLKHRPTFWRPLPKPPALSPRGE